ncbi:HGWP repeat containing protein-like [Senna tora]|uniref:HGWP repeat containing protein-like n=1 Tax=Senna tora TaxID=362788 RepID=A0A834WZ38_9FABA|nr:HGWP repeat containing protein-like [Senna tora]
MKRCHGKTTQLGISHGESSHTTRDDLATQVPILEPDPIPDRDVFEEDDNENIMRSERLSVYDVWVLTSGKRVVVEFNEMNQSIGDVGGLLGQYLGILERNWMWFPLSYQTWRKVPIDSKMNVYEN